jgi:hypothetical protein
LDTVMGWNEQPLDPLANVAWAATLGPFRCFGRVFCIRTDSEEVAEFLATLYEPMLNETSQQAVVFSLVTPDGRTYGSVHRDQVHLRASAVPSVLLGTLVWAINRLVIQPDSDAVVLHAAAADLDGRAVVLPAPMESGKTTLVAGLLGHGLNYLTDEAVELEADDAVSGYPKPLSIDPGSWHVLAHLEPKVSPVVRPYLEEQWQVAAASLSEVVPRSQVAAIVFPRYVAGAATDLARLPPATALRLAVACTFGPENAIISSAQMHRLGGVFTRVPAYRLSSSSLVEACEAIIGQLRGASERARI